MSVIRSLVVALSMFSRIPMPRMEWDARSMRWALAFLPLVGVLVAGVLLLWHYIAGLLELNVLVFSAGFALLPLLVTGSIHMDGLCDTIDALASNGDVATKQRILKDSSTGAFAVIGAVAYLLLFAAFASELAGNWLLIASFCCVLVLSRALGGLSMMWFPLARTSGLAHTFSHDSQKRPTTLVLLIIACISAGGAIGLNIIPGIAAVIVVVLVFFIVKAWLVKQFGGLSGDLVGWFIQMSELCALVGMVLAHKIVCLM